MKSYLGFVISVVLSCMARKDAVGKAVIATRPQRLTHMAHGYGLHSLSVGVRQETCGSVDHRGGKDEGDHYVRSSVQAPRKAVTENSMEVVPGGEAEGSQGRNPSH